MKKLIFVLLAIISLSCSKDEKESNTYKCNGKFQLWDSYGYFYISGVIIDKNTNQPVPNQNIQQDAIFCGCE